MSEDEHASPHDAGMPDIPVILMGKRRDRARAHRGAAHRSAAHDDAKAEQPPADGGTGTDRAEQDGRGERDDAPDGNGDRSTGGREPPKEEPGGDEAGRRPEDDESGQAEDDPEPLVGDEDDEEPLAAGPYAHAENGDAAHNMRKNRAGRDYFENSVIINPFTAPGTDDYVEYAPDDLERLLARYVRSPNHEDLVAAVEHNRVVAVSGVPGTGRTMTAVAALRDAGYRVGSISPRVPPARIVADRLRDGHGYVLDATYASWAHSIDVSVLQTMSGKIKDTNCRLIIITGAGTLTDSVSATYVVRHRAPDPWEVTAAYLGEKLTGRDAEGRAALRRLFEKADLPHRPRVLAQAAEDYSELDWPGFQIGANRLEEAARERLIKPAAMSREDWIGCRSFLIAWAVLDGRPAAEVCEAAVDLADHLYRVERPDLYRAGNDGESGEDRRRLRRGPLTERFDRWFGYAAEIDGATRSSNGTNPAESPLTFHNDRFGPALIRVLWNDHPVVREPLMRWLDRYVMAESRDVRRRAALVVGSFASQDFAYIKNRYFTAWVGDRYIARHWAVARAIEEACRVEPRLAPEANALTRELSGGGLTRQSAAVRAYGTTVGAENVDGALRDLRSIAARSGTELGTAILGSLTSLFLGGAEEQVTKALTDWARSGDAALTRLAAEALDRIARRNDPRTGRTPALLDYAGGGPAALDAVAGLWNAVLTGPAAGQGHWRILREWHRRTPRPPALDDLITALARDASLRPRLRFKLGGLIPEVTS